MYNFRDIAQVWPVLLATLVATACSDSTAPIGDSWFAGRWAGSPWLGEAEALFVGDGADGDTLYLFGIRPVNAGSLPEDIVTIRVPFRGAGTYPLAADAVEYVVLTGGDVVSGGYAGRSPTAGTLVVDSYNAASGFMAGTVMFQAVATGQLQPFGPAAEFEDGRFRVSVRRSQ